MKETDLTDKEQRIIQSSVLVILLIVFVVLFYLRLNHVIPGPAKIIEFLRDLYSNYGYSVVFVAAILEGLIFINAYIPGSTAILLGVVFARQSGLSVPLVIGLAILGFIVSYTINYLIGRYAIKGFLTRVGYAEQVNKLAKTVNRKGYWFILTSYFHPNMAALVATAAGVAHMPYIKFLMSSLVALLIWDSAWGLLAYHVGEAALKLSESPWAYLVVLVWVGISYGLTARATKGQ